MSDITTLIEDYVEKWILMKGKAPEINQVIQAFLITEDVMSIAMLRQILDIYTQKYQGYDATPRMYKIDLDDD